MTQEPAEFQIRTPDSVMNDPDAVEMLRFWWSRGEPVMAIKPAFEDPARYGAMLAIAARNIAHVYHQSRGDDEAQTYRAVLKGLNEALKGPGYETIAEPRTESDA